jgi:hypothetical protein
MIVPFDQKMSDFPHTLQLTKKEFSSWREERPGGMKCIMNTEDKEERN